MKIYRISQSKKRVSFDFDNTLLNNIWNNEENDFERDENGNMIGYPNVPMIEMMKQYLNRGYEVLIVTSRMDKYKQDVVEFVQEQGLPVSEIICTNGENKVFTLIDLGVLEHFDDDPHEIQAIKNNSNIQAYQI